MQVWVYMLSNEEAVTKKLLTGVYQDDGKLVSVVAGIQATARIRDEERRKPVGMV